jgi:ribosomal protein S18 acetylase RimI-like enzyme
MSLAVLSEQSMKKTGLEPTFDLQKLVIRQVSEVDLPALEWEGEYLKYRRMFASLYKESLSGRTLLWVATLPEEACIGQAFVMLKSSERETADGHQRAYLFAFRVKPAWRNRGIGRVIMDFVESDLRDRGFKFITLNVAKDNLDALRLYKRLGYRVIGSRSGNWTYRDHTGRLQYVHEPDWRMIKGLDKD